MNHFDIAAPANMRSLDQMAHSLAALAVISDIESEAVRVHLPEPGRWYDTRPMLDPREHAPEIVDMATQALDYALQQGLVHRHSQQQHLVRINLLHIKPSDG